MNNSYFLLAILLCSYFCTTANKVTSTTESDIDVTPRDDRVAVEIFYESLCPYCQEFFLQQLNKTLNTPDIWSVADFQLYPYGNAEMTKKGHFYSVSCQHGVGECQGNIIHNCALKLYNPVTQSIPFIVCLEGSQNRWNIDGELCATANKMEWSRVKACTNSLYGKEWLYETALKTDRIQNSHVPYIVIDGVYSTNLENAALSNLLGTICSSYKGTRIIEACKSQVISDFTNWNW